MTTAAVSAPEKRRFMRRTRLAAGVAASLFLIWFAVNNYLSAIPIAEENLRGLALTLIEAVEKIASDDASFRNLRNFRTDDIAYYAIITRDGEYLFHSNEDLIGTRTEGAEEIAALLREKNVTERRVTLGTGERAFELSEPIDLARGHAVLRLILHTYRAESVVRRARMNLALMIALVATGWGMTAILYRMGKREELLQSEMARRENLAKLGEMGAVLAHEIRNPLAGIKGYAQVIEKRPAEPRNGSFAAQIVKEVLRLEDLVSELLLYAAAGNPVFSEVHVSHVIEQAVSLVRHEAVQNGVHIVVSCPEELVVHGNGDRLAQVLLNLAKNAVQAMPDGGELTVSACEQGQMAAIVVSDTGIGISEQEKQRIFEPFFTTKARGTGLGLPLCKKIVEEHGGDISLTSVPEAGTSVTLRLPCRERNIRNMRSIQ